MAQAHLRMTGNGAAMGQMGSDDLLLAAIRYAPLLFAVGGLLLLAWFARQRSGYELRPDVLAALSETEALSAAAIRRRLPPHSQNLDAQLLVRILDELCGAGLAVRWYELAPDAAPDAADRQAVYRRVRSLTETAG